MELVRLNLYNKGDFCGNQAIQWEMMDMEVQPIPSLSTIGRILQRRELTHRRTGRYTPKGKKYPVLPALLPNQTHQVDLVGPCYLTGSIRFYSLHAVDAAINLCGIEPMFSKAAQSVLDSVYAVWLPMETKLIFPSKSDAPKHPLDKPEEGCYHLVRFIRNDCRLNIFSEMFQAPPETQYEYVVATVDVKEQKLKLFLDKLQIEEYKYQLR